MKERYQQAVAYMNEIPKFTTTNSLDHTKKCLRRLGNPQEAFRVIHVAGTNGKGSTCAFLTSVLREAGYSCGLFTSPHLVDVNERFQINEEMIDNETFLHAFDRVKALGEELIAEGDRHPTYFEFFFLMGMLIFAEAGVDYVTLETGLGGRLDATTAVENPLLCVITSISFDHQQYLGNTIPEIAAEKAGIIVPGVPVVFDGNDRQAAAVIRETAEKLGSPYCEVCREDAEIHKVSPKGIDFSLKNGYDREEIFHVPFIGRYQVMNATLSLKALEFLRKSIPLSDSDIRRGIANTRWQGRMETVLPGVIVDGAHNEDGVARFVETAAEFQKEYPITLLFSAVSDKDYHGMIGDICKTLHPQKIFTTQIEGYRIVPAQELSAVFHKYGVEAEPIASISEAFARAVEEKGDGLCFCVGSLYLVGEIKSIIRRNQND